ncbi:ribonuclease P 40kDa subunit [Hypoxylon sp. FL1284]|nr:ribonuclease P 40kDa subunit [Hypoxylon sp. FL1284]
MFSFPKPSVYQSSKCSVTYGVMSHPDPRKVPSKGKPWSTLLAQDFVHRVDLIFPDEVLQLVRDNIVGNPSRAPTFYKVIMSLGQILEGDFFTEYTKAGVLTLYLDKETYERAGLVGQPHGAKGKRGLKPRWVMQLDLRSPSMVHGKKGFDRLVYACKNALSAPVTWLFYSNSKTPIPDPLSRHYPTKYTSHPEVSEGLLIKIPSIKPPPTVLGRRSSLELDDFATDIYEWLSLLRLESPRVNVDDKIDPYLSGYTVPGDPDDGQNQRLFRVSWQGFIPPSWTQQILADAVLSLPSKSWFSLSATSFARGITGDSADCTFLRPPNSLGDYFLWDIRRHD